MLYLRHYDAVAQVCKRRLRDPHLAEDATQETFLRAWKALPNFTHDVDLTHWLRRIARNHCADLYRAAARERSVTSSDVVLDEADPAAQDAVESVPEGVAVRALLARLRPRDAELLVDHHAAGVGVRALAERWRMTKGAMEVALHRARQRARRSAEERGLRSLAPLVITRRAWDGAQRAVGQLGESAVPVVSGLGNLAMVAVLVFPPGSVPGGPATPQPSATVAGSGGDVVSHAPSTAIPGALSRPRASNPEGTRRAARRPGSPSHRQADDPDRITVPGTKHTVSRSMTGAHAGTIGTRDPVLGEGADVEFDDEDWEPMLEAYERSCPVAEAGDPVTYCERG